MTTLIILFHTKKIQSINSIVISFQYERFSYLGGSHGDAENCYINYNRLTGEALTSDGLYIEYGRYELAPYSAGFPLLSISKRVLKNYFINDGTVY